MDHLRDAAAAGQLGCDELRERHGDYIDGLLPVDAQQQIEAHIAACAQCARYDRVVRRGLQLVHDLPQLAPSDDFEERLRHRIFHIQDDAALAHDRPAAGVGVAAAVAGIIALLAWSPVLLRERSSEPSRIAGTEALHDTAVLVMPVPRADPLGDVVAGWYVSEVRTPVAARSLVFPGPYSPLIVNPPVHGGAVRTISTEYHTFE